MKMRHSQMARLQRRLDAAEIALAARWADHAMRMFGDALKAAPELVRDRVLVRLRLLHRNYAEDPARHADSVTAILLATAEVAPGLARQVAEKLSIDLPAASGSNDDTSEQ